MKYDNHSIFITKSYLCLVRFHEFFFIENIMDVQEIPMEHYVSEFDSDTIDFWSSYVTRLLLKKHLTQWKYMLLKIYYSQKYKSLLIKA